MSDRRRATLKRIRSLMQMTRARGASEAEAAAAMEAAARLMAEHDLSEKDVELSASEFEGYLHPMKGMRPNRGDSHPVQWLCGAVGELVNVRVAFALNNLVIIGRSHETQIACHMLDMLKGAIDRAWLAEAALHKKAIGALRDPFVVRHLTQKLLGARAKRSFKIGVSVRLSERIHEMAKKNRETVASSGTDLVVVRDNLLDEAASNILKGAKVQKAKLPDIDKAAFANGVAAGGTIPISQGIEAGKDQARRIGR